jgi:hypothetical protein
MPLTIVLDETENLKHHILYHIFQRKMRAFPYFPGNHPKKKNREEFRERELYLKVLVLIHV